MIASGLVLFLVGTAVAGPAFRAPVANEIIISKNRHPSADKVTEYYPSSNKSPFISNFIQKGTNVFFKPQFVLAASQMPPQVQAMIAEIEKDDCKTSYPMGPVPVMPIVEEPLRIIEKEVFTSPDIKEVIEINPMVYPRVPMPKAPILVEEPCEVPLVAPVQEVIMPMVIPRAPELPAVVFEEKVISEPMPEIVEIIEPARPMVIPEAPILPPYVPREIPAPIIVEEFKPVSFEVEKEVILPPAPVLPPLEIPQTTVIVEETNMIPCPPSEVVQEIISQPFVLPAAPVLPSYIPEVIVPQPAPIVIEEKPIVIPQAPELPPFSMPKLPVEVIVEENIIPQVIPSLPCETVEIIEEHVQPMVIPEAPVLPPLAPVELPAPVVVEVEKSNEPIVLPFAPALPSLELAKAPIMPVPCDTVEVIEEYVRPLVVPEAPLLPPLAPIEIPAPVIIEEPVVLPPAPVLTPLEMPKVVPVPCETVEIIEEHVRPIPEAPLLPPLAPLAIPSPVIVEKPINIEIEKEIVRPVVLPSAPVLPPLEILKAPIMVENPAEVIVAPCPPEREIVIEQRPLMPMPMPYRHSELALMKPVMAPQYYFPYVPQSVVKGESVMVEKNSLLPVPAPCDDDVVVERVFPKINIRPTIAQAPGPIHFARLSNAVL